MAFFPREHPTQTQACLTRRCGCRVDRRKSWLTEQVFARTTKTIGTLTHTRLLDDASPARFFHSNITGSCSLAPRYCILPIGTRQHHPRRSIYIRQTGALATGIPMVTFGVTLCRPTHASATIGAAALSEVDQFEASLSMPGTLPSVFQPGRAKSTATVAIDTYWFGSATSKPLEDGIGWLDDIPTRLFTCLSEATRAMILRC